MSTNTTEFICNGHPRLGIGPTLSAINILRETTLKKTNAFSLQMRPNCR